MEQIFARSRNSCRGCTCRHDRGGHGCHRAVLQDGAAAVKAGALLVATIDLLLDSRYACVFFLAQNLQIVFLVASARLILLLLLMPFSFALRRKRFEFIFNRHLILLVEDCMGLRATNH